MARLTRRESALAWNSQAPIGMEIPVPAKRVTDPNAPKEWRLQVACVKLCREYQAHRKDFRFIAPMAEAQRDPKRAAIAKSMGLNAGVLDLHLYRLKKGVMLMLIVELKLPGKPLTPEQREWADFYRAGNIPAVRIDNLNDFTNALREFLEAP